MRRKISYNIKEMALYFFLLLVIVFILYLIGKLNNSRIPNASLIVLFSDIILIILALPVIKKLLNFMRGDSGEMDIKFILEKFRGYYCLSDLVIENNGNIDSVVIGPTGIWTIEVKNLTEKVVIHDKYLDEQINQALAEKLSLQNFLLQNGIDKPVTPVLVFANKRSRLNFGMVPQRGVYIIGRPWLGKLLKEHSTGYFPPQLCDQIVQILKPKTSIIN
jgi:hypothetical protein